MPDTPITDVVNLARAYTAEQWREAGHRCASLATEDICRAIYRARLADSMVMPECSQVIPLPVELSEALDRLAVMKPGRDYPDSMQSDIWTVLRHFGRLDD